MLAKAVFRVDENIKKGEAITMHVCEALCRKEGGGGVIISFLASRI